MAYFDRFNQRWAVAGVAIEPTPPESDAGFIFLGPAPPTVELFNSLLQWDDDKDNWLFNQMAGVMEPNAPTEGDIYQLRDAIRQMITDAIGPMMGNYVLKAGDTMTGPLRLAPGAVGIGYNTVGTGNGNLVAFDWSAAATLDAYVDGTFVGTLANRVDLTGYLPLTGGNLSGQLTVANAFYPVFNTAPDMLFYYGAPYRTFQWGGGWVNQWDETNGRRRWLGPGIELMTLDGTGNFWVANTIAAATNMSCISAYASNEFSAGSRLYSGNDIIAVGPINGSYVGSSGDISAVASIYAGATVQGAYINSLGSINAAGSITAPVGNIQGRYLLAHSNAGWDGSVIQVGSSSAYCWNMYCDAMGSLFVQNIAGSLGQGYFDVSPGGDFSVHATLSVDSFSTFLGTVYINVDPGMSISNGYQGSIFLGQSGAGATIVGLPNLCRLATISGGGFEVYAGGATLQGALTQTSDRRIKTNIEDYTAGIDELLQVQPRTFNYIEEVKISSEIQIGIVADEIEDVLPGSVGVRPGVKILGDVEMDDLKTFNPIPLLMALVNSNKQLYARVVALESRGKLVN